MGVCPLVRNQILDGGARDLAFEEAGLIVEPIQCEQFLLLTQLGFLNGGFQHLDGLVVDA